MTWRLTLAGLPRAGANSKPYDYKQKVQETKERQKMNFTENLSRDFRPKETKNPVIVWRTKQKNHKTPMAKTEHEPCRQEEINGSKIEKSIQNKTVGTLQD